MYPHGKLLPMAKTPTKKKAQTKKRAPAPPRVSHIAKGKVQITMATTKQVHTVVKRLAKKSRRSISSQALVMIEIAIDTMEERGML